MSIEHSPARDGTTPQAPDRIVGERECGELTDLSRTTRWRLMRSGLFPAKVSLSPNRAGWKLSAILEWLKALKAAA